VSRLRAAPATALALWLAAAAALPGCDSAPGRPRASDRELAPWQVRDFAALYGGSCAGCHGADGRLGAAQPLHDPVYLALVPTERLRQVIARGVPGTPMPGFAASSGGALGDEQIEALVAGMLQRWAEPGAVPAGSLPPYADERGDPERGAAVYAEACAACHGRDGRGAAKGGAVVEPSYLALVSDQGLRTAVIAGRPDLGMPDWRGEDGPPLSNEQVSDVVAWLAAQRGPVEGRPPLPRQPGAGGE
jgi:mono/diheme cytochrome c family protein